MKKETKMNRFFEYSLVGILVLSLSGCSMAWDQSVKPQVNEDELKSSVAKIVDEQLEVVGPYLEQNDTIKGVIDFDDITGDQVVEGVLNEVNGHSYLEFAYDTAYNSEDNLEEFVVESKKLLPEKEAQELDEKIEETKKAIYGEYEDLGRAVPPSQQIAFQKDLRKLVTRSVVLFIAGVVYTFLPTTMFWGKISAAAAISVATGVLSCSVMSLYQYYKYGGDIDQSFEQWLEEVSTEPQISYALAASMITVGTTMKRSPVVTGLTICVFSLYKVIDMVKPMLKKYNFDV
jgi:hypothetical protein